MVPCRWHQMISGAPPKVRPGLCANACLVKNWAARTILLVFASFRQGTRWIVFSNGKLPICRCNNPKARRCRRDKCLTRSRRGVVGEGGGHPRFIRYQSTSNGEDDFMSIFSQNEPWVQGDKKHSGSGSEDSILQVLLFDIDHGNPSRLECEEIKRKIESAGVLHSLHRLVGSSYHT